MKASTACQSVVEDEEGTITGWDRNVHNRKSYHMLQDDVHGRALHGPKFVSPAYARSCEVVRDTATTDGVYPRPDLPIDLKGLSNA